MPQQPVLLAEPIAQMLHGHDPHVFQGAIEEHGAVETGRVMPHFGDEILVAQQHQSRVDFRLARKPARMSGCFAGRHLQHQVAQGIGIKQGLVSGSFGGGVSDRGLSFPNHCVLAVGVESGQGVAEVLNAFAKCGDGGGVGGDCGHVGCLTARVDGRGATEQ